MTYPSYSSLLVDLAKHLANNGIAQWSDTGVYKNVTPPRIYLGRIPDEVQTNAIAINVYSDDRTNDDTSAEIRVQIRVKGTRHPLECVNIADRIFQLLHRQSNYKLNNNTRVLASNRHLRAPEEQDANLIWHQPDSYTFTLNN